ncbi:Ig-like domain-containing protein [Clostridium perfringens]|uniref:Ig-like domain-containing protein n=1 Tax=Clostridium perfringens TaxID=1502 RepID=UPI002ED193B1|nr:Ig-like domain-containing protein [Clostridium perfringens]
MNNKVTLPVWIDKSASNSGTQVSAANLNAMCEGINQNASDISSLSDALVLLDKTKFDKVMLEGNTLKFYAKEIEKFSISLPTGSGGSGVPGQDGREIELRKGSTHIEWRYVGESNWTSLVALDELKGENGAPGRDGVTPNITIGTVETLAPGSNATVTKTGTTEAPVFNFGIPQGQPGSGEGGSIDLSAYQTKRDEKLTTTEKEIVAAINEVASYTSQNTLDIEQLKQGGSLSLRDPLPNEIFEIDNGSTPPTTVYGNIVLSKTSTTIIEGQSDTFTVKLDKVPTNNQIVTLSKNNNDVTLNPTSLTFTPQNYNTAQTVTITVAEDNEDYSNESCTITLSSPNVSNKTLEVAITDNDEAPSNIPVQSINLNHESSTIKVDGTLQLTPIFNPPNATNQNVTWSSDNDSFARVSTSGLVTGVGEGSCVITCTTQDGNKTASCYITVEAKLTGSNLNTSVKNGLTHMYDFTTLKQNDLVATDLIGSSNINIPSGFNTEGCIAYKDTHFNAGELLERDFTVLGEIKYGSGDYTFYCGDKSLVVNNGSTKIKIGTLVKDLENLRLRPKQYYVICIKYDYNNKQMTLFVNGNLIHTLTHSDPINDNSIYISFASNTVEFGENYSLLVYNRQLTNEEVKTVSSEIKRKTINTDNILGISNKVGLKEFYDFNSITGEERIFNSLAGENALNVTGAISSNNGLVLGTGSQNLTSKYNIPFDTECTYFIKFTPPNSSIKGNKIIEFENVSLNISKTTAELKVGGLTTQSFEPVLNEKNIIAITINALSKEGKIYHNGLLKQTISNIEVSYIDGKMYMLANDLINHNIIMYDKVLNDSEIKAITRELEVI